MGGPARRAASIALLRGLALGTTHLPGWRWLRRSLYAGGARGLAVLAAAALAACAVDRVTFQQAELCAVPGDEDGNELADCLDPACGAGAATCTASATCNSDCSLSRCGDLKHNPASNEECDLGPEDSTACNSDCTTPRCGDGRLNPLAGEEVDPPTSLSSTVPVNPETCRYDFAAMTQLYCTGTCGTWGGGSGCQQEDADAFCKLKTGNPAATASAFTAVATELAPGICCPSQAITGCKLLGTFAGRGVPQNVYIHDTDLRTSHGGGQAISNPTCVVP